VGDAKWPENLAEWFPIGGGGGTSGFWSSPKYGLPEALTLNSLERAMTEDQRRRDAGEYDKPRPLTVSPGEFIQFTGCCGACHRPLEEMAASDQQLARRQCACGAFLPKAWRACLRTFAVTLGAT
jgi:hypothetical protein